MNAKRKAPPRRWKEAKLAQRFNWWWRERGEAFRDVFPDARAKARAEPFRGMLNACAFNYELMARHGMQRGAAPAYEFGVPFNRLPPDLMSHFQKRWRGTISEPPFEAMDYGARPSVILTLSRLQEDIVDEGGEKGRREHKRRVELRTKIEQAETSTGWTVPRYFRFNLGAHSPGTIAKGIEKWLEAKRKAHGIPKAPRNKNRKNRSKRGRAFTDIEALDVWTHLPRAEAELTAYDDAQKRRAVREAKRLNNSISSE